MSLKPTILCRLEGEDLARLRQLSVRKTAIEITDGRGYTRDEIEATLMGLYRFEGELVARFPENYDPTRFVRMSPQDGTVIQGQWQED
jgi:hypothetical protein